MSVGFYRCAVVITPLRWNLGLPVKDLHVAVVEVFNQLFCPAESGNIQDVREITVHLAYSLFLYVCIPKLGMTLHGSANLSGSEHITQSQFVVVCCAKLIVLDISNLPLGSVL